MPSSAVYQQLVRRSVRLAMTNAALCRRATWMECWMASPTSADEIRKRLLVRGAPEAPLEPSSTPLGCRYKFNVARVSLRARGILAGSWKVSECAERECRKDIDEADEACSGDRLLQVDSGMSGRENDGRDLLIYLGESFGLHEDEISVAIEVRVEASLRDSELLDDGINTHLSQ